MLSSKSGALIALRTALKNLSRGKSELFATSCLQLVPEEHHCHKSGLTGKSVAPTCQQRLKQQLGHQACWTGERKAMQLALNAKWDIQGLNHCDLQWQEARLQAHFLMHIEDFRCQLLPACAGLPTVSRHCVCVAPRSQSEQAS